MHQLWDKLFKIIGDRYPEEIVKFLFPNKDIKLFGKYEQEKVILQYQIADINFWIKDRGEKKLLNIEPYSSWKRSIPGKVFTRNGILTKSLRHNYEVISVVVLLDKESQIGKYKVRLGGEVINTYRFPVVNFENIEEILNKYPPLVPFILKVDRSYQDRVIAIAKKDKVLTAMTVLVLNRFGFTQEEALDMVGTKLQEFKDALLEVPIMQNIWKEDAIRAKIEALRGALLKRLNRKFGIISQALQAKLEKIDSAERLDDLIDKALQSVTLADFESQLG